MFSSIGCLLSELFLRFLFKCFIGDEGVFFGDAGVAYQIKILCISIQNVKLMPNLPISKNALMKQLNIL